MTYTRFVIAPSGGIFADGSSLWEMYTRVSQVWEHDDGTSMYRIECDDPGFLSLMNQHNAGTVTVMPSLNAPASAASPRVTAYLAKQGVVPGQADTVLNVLRKIRDSKGSPALIDQPY